MDPNETLRMLREAYSKVEDVRGDATGPLADAASDLRDAAVALDEWLSRGGLLPEPWRSATPEPRKIVARTLGLVADWLPEPDANELRQTAVAVRNDDGYLSCPLCQHDCQDDPTSPCPLAPFRSWPVTVSLSDPSDGEVTW